MTDAATLLIVGCGHWGNPGLDFHQVEFDDMLAPRRQSEIEECLTRLLRFEPSKVALEVTADQMNQVNREYAGYRGGTFRLTANERHQLGFRLASTMGHEQVFGIDWHHPTQPIGWDHTIDFALKNDQASLVDALTSANNNPEETRTADAAKAVQKTVREQLRECSDTYSNAQGHQVYMDMARIGRGDNYVGADVILRWYERNMKMFVNLARLLEPGERVLLVVGSGHLPLLIHFLEGGGRYRVESALDYLRP